MVPYFATIVLVHWDGRTVYLFIFLTQKVTQGGTESNFFFLDGLAYKGADW